MSLPKCRGSCSDDKGRGRFGIKVLFLSSSRHPIVEELKEKLSSLGVKSVTLYLQDIKTISLSRSLATILFLVKLLGRDSHIFLKLMSIMLKSGLKIRNLMECVRYSVFAAFIYKVVVKNNFDIIHAFWSYPAGISAILAKALVHKPVVISVLGYDVDERTLKDTLLTGVSKFAMENCDAVIVATENHYRNLLGMGINRNLLHFIPLGINVTRFIVHKAHGLSLRKRLGISEDEIVVLFVPHLRDLYGPQDFLRAAEIVSKKVQNVRFILVGDGPLRKDLNNLAKSLNIKAMFAGHVDFYEMPLYYAMADIVCIPSYAGQGISALEAMATGKPVVGYKTGTIRITDGIDGFLVQKGDVKGLAEKILLLVKDSSLRKIMGDNARSKVASLYDIKLCANRILGLYSSIIKRRVLEE
jgi:glycosyltransferase involved in cell wall biosynthesis